MQVLDLQQNTDGWLESRKKMIGGSDVPIIMGVSPWKTAYQLWEEKTGKVIEDNSDKKWLFAKGHRLEDRARVLLELKLGYDLPSKVIKHSELEYCQVSLDGLNVEEKVIAEIKYVGEESFEKSLEDNYVPEHYMPQLQYQMLASGLETNLYVPYSEKRDTILVIEVAADKSYIKKMIKECDKFYKNVKNETEPELSDKDFKEVKKKDMIDAMWLYKELDEQSKQVKSQMEKIKTIVMQKAEEHYPKHKRYTGAGIKVSTTSRKGSTDWKTLCKDERISEEKIKEYEKKPTTVITFRIGKK